MPRRSFLAMVIALFSGFGAKASPEHPLLSCWQMEDATRDIEAGELFEHRGGVGDVGFIIAVWIRLDGSEQLLILPG